MAGNPVLLLHGFTTSARRTWHEPGWVDLLTEAGREVIAPDLLGHGDAPKPHDPAEYDAVEQLVEDALPPSPVDGVGYSAGARILLVLASRDPDRFGRLVVGGIGKSLFERREGNPILDALQGTAGLDDPDPLDAGQKHTHHFLVTEHVPTEQCERIVMPCLQEFLQVPGDIPGRFIVGI